MHQEQKNKPLGIHGLRHLLRSTCYLQYAMSLTQEHGASSWLTALPIQEPGFALQKGAFHDALALRYGWQPSHLPSKCACEAPYIVEHALSSTRCGFHTLQHNNIRNLTTKLPTDVCHEVGTEPHLQSSNGEHFAKATAIRDNNARVNNAASGFGGGSTAQPTGNPACLPPTLGTKKRRRGLMAKESWMWNLPPSHC